MTAAQLPDFDREIAQANASIAEIKRKMANVIAYISKRAELTFSQLKMNRVEISLYDVVKSTGEVKDTFKFQYGGPPVRPTLSFGEDPGRHGGL